MLLAVQPLGGTLPAQWSSLTALTRLSLGGLNTNVNGSLPAQWGSLSRLQALELDVLSGATGLSGNRPRTTPGAHASCGRLSRIHIPHHTHMHTHTSLLPACSFCCLVCV